MTPENKELLLKYLCMALPYGVICYNSNTESNFKLCDVADIDSGYPTFDYGCGELETIKPYLRSMSSMTEEEAMEYANCGSIIANSPQMNYLIPNPNSINWLLEHHFDFMDLISKGLAIEVTDKNKPYKN